MANQNFQSFNTYKIDPLTEIRNAGLITNGDVYWVSSVSDSLHRKRTDQLGRKVVKVTVQAAVADAKTNNNDYIMVIPTDGGTVVPLGTAIDVNKNRLHILGVGGKPAPMGYNGLTFQGFVSANGIDTELMAVTGAGCEVGGIKLLGTSGTADLGTITAHLLIGTASSGTPHDLWVHDVHIENTQAAAANGTTDIVSITGNVAGGITGIRFERCWLGNWNWAPSAIVRMGGTAGPTRAGFYNTKFIMDAQATTDKFTVLGTGQTEYTWFESCDFVNVEAGTLPASVHTGAILVDNPAILKNCTYVNVTAAGTDTEAYKVPSFSGTQAAMFDLGIANGTAAVIPA